MNDSISIQFPGAAQCVTGSKYLLGTPGSTTSIDCGLFRGLIELRQRNWEAFPFPAAEIDQVILTQKHIDHTGYLPRLRKDGFDEPVYCTPSPAELLALLSPDCGHLPEEDARYSARKGFSKRANPLPLFTAQDGVDALRSLRPVTFGKHFGLDEHLAFQYHPTGHVLGAGSLEIEAGPIRLWFSGDLGRYRDEVMNSPGAGFQAEGTRGRALLGGSQELRIHGQFVPVKVEITSISRLSAHGDQRDLMRWLSTFRHAPQRVFLVHGEEDGLHGLDAQIRDQLKWPTHIPKYLEQVTLTSN